MNLRGIVIGVAIFILTMFVAVYGISVFMPQPEFNDFCPDSNSGTVANTIDSCQNLGGKWTEYNFVKAPGPDEATGYCDLQYYCRQDYEAALKDNSKNRFLVSIPLGILIIVLGGVIFKLESVGVGLMAGGAGTFVYGAGSYWGYATDIWRFFISLFGLVVLIIFAYWFEKKLRKGFWKKFFGKKK